MATGPRLVVIGVGNPFRGDDGIGHRVVDRLAAEVAEAVRAERTGRLRTVELHESDGEATRMLEHWSGADLAVVVDAMTTGAEPGRVRVFEPGTTELPARSLTSSHASGIAEAWALGEVLEILPAHLLVIGVEAASVAEGTELSPPVRAALPRVLRLVHAAIAATPDPPGPPPVSRDQPTLPFLDLTDRALAAAEPEIDLRSPDPAHRGASS